MSKSLPKYFPNINNQKFEKGNQSETFHNFSPNSPYLQHKNRRISSGRISRLNSFHDRNISKKFTKK